MREISLAGKRVLIAGGSTGIGRACAIGFAEEGAEVQVAALPGEDLDSLSTHHGFGGRLRTYGGDFADEGFIARLVADVGDLDILVYSAGVAPLAPFLDSDPSNWDWIYSVNVRGLLRLVQPVAKRMIARGSGHFILVSSTLAHAVYPNTLVYAASKHAMSAIHKGLRLELGSFGIQSTELRPGLVGGTGIRRISGPEHPAAAQDLQHRPYKPIEAEDIARAALFVAKAPPGVDIDVIEVKPVGQP
ncbi:SDR family oxidoreductase [Bradyrhizobium sp. Arg314]